MQKTNSWLLPEGIEDVLPADAKYLEDLRRRLLDLFACWGYKLVIPPVVDFLDSLLTGAGHDLDLQTFKLTDQASGELLGIRADMTPQVARIDAHNLKYDRPTRLCYVGTILLALGNSLEKNRSPMQIGAEIYGHSSIESDLEVMQLMLEMLALTGLQNIHLDLGHVSIYRALSEQAGLSAEQETALFDILQRKARTDLENLLDQCEITPQYKAIFLTLPTLNGGIDVLDQAETALKNTGDIVISALNDLRKIAEKLAVYFPSLPVSFDLAELRGYHYHTGLVFTAFIPDLGREIARGGRYDNIGQLFGRARAATGFSADLKLLTRLSQVYAETDTPELIYAPFVEDDIDLIEMIRDLRAKDRAVVQQLPGHFDQPEILGCTAVLEKHNKEWRLKPLV